MPHDNLPPNLLEAIQAEAHGEIRDLEPLKGGVISETARVTLDNGDTYVLKWCSDAKPDLYRKEADGLERLNLDGCPRVPAVVSFSESHLLLEDLGSGAPPSPAQWTAFGRQVGRLHTFHGEQFGFDYDNYLGLTDQLNTWDPDGHAFFVERRVLPYVDQGMCAEILTPDDRKRIERLCSRLRDLVPAQPPSLCHGDLWCANVLSTRYGDMAYVDPAIYYGWAEADLSMTIIIKPFPDAFYAGYLAVNPLETGWRERIEVYLIKEHLVSIAQFGDRFGSLGYLRGLLDRFA